MNEAEAQLNRVGNSADSVHRRVDIVYFLVSPAVNMIIWRRTIHQLVCHSASLHRLRFGVEDANDFAIEREAVFSLESSIHQLLCQLLPRLRQGGNQAFNDVCGVDFRLGSAPHCAGSDLRERGTPTSGLTWRTDVIAQRPLARTRR